VNGNVETVSGDPTTTSRLFEPWRLGRIELANRVVMAPMTRNRADDDGVLPESAVTYYEQRAGAGLIVSEATQPSSAGQGYPGTPGIHDDRQESQWAKVADAVHAKGGKIFCQLMHTGRMSHESFMPPGGKVVAPSPIRADIEVETIDRVMVPAPVPTELDQDGIDAIIRDFADASERARSTAPTATCPTSSSHRAPTSAPTVTEGAPRHGRDSSWSCSGRSVTGSVATGWGCASHREASSTTCPTRATTRPMSP
jgi:N-ethylmaleimide reductase